MAFELVSIETAQELAHEYGYWSVFLGILLENTGIPIPGETITLVGGFLAGSGDLQYKYVLASATAGAVVGDNLGYWIGYFGGWPLLTRLGKLFRIDESKLVEVRNQFSENAAKAVFLGRFVALLRIFAGPLAGIARMPYPQFLLCNSAGAIVWAGAMVTLSYVVGQMVPLATLIGWVTQFGVVALLVVIGAIALSIWLDSRTKEQLGD
ncbi:DedA family protein [Leptolyngbya sp. AN02str]|uniref:DedA family protein n=1 Tax=Leptolyngbya sp. AN02str TaxID=3423363 RepID=UPI003D30F372